MSGAVASRVPPLHDRPEEPPHAIGSEEALLGAILHNPAALDGVRHLIEPDDFYSETNAWLYEAMCARRDAGEHVDIRLVMTALGNRDLGADTVGTYLGRLGAEAITVVNAPSYARAVRQAARMRRVLDTARAAQSAMTSGGVSDPTAYATQMIADLDEIASGGLAEHLQRTPIGASALDVVKRVQAARDGHVRHGASYGLPSLDRATLGMRDKQLIILAGRPGMGKTTVGVHFGLSAARKGYGVYFVSLEMDADELAERALSAIAYDHRANEELSYRTIAHGRDVSDHGLSRLVEAQRVLEQLPLEIEQQPGLTVAQIAARARQHRLRLERRGQFLGLVVIDHIGLISASKRYAGNRVQELTEITAALKGLAKELGVPVLGLSQLSRGIENREDKRPKLADLRDSGSIEQDADVVIGLFREAYYLEHLPEPTPEEEDRLARSRNVLELEILKQRGGPTQRIECFCNIACNILAELAS